MQLMNYSYYGAPFLNAMLYMVCVYLVRAVLPVAHGLTVFMRTLFSTAALTVQLNPVGSQNSFTPCACLAALLK